MRFVWFLHFWGWSRETYRAGMSLRHPLEGIGGYWDEWFNEETKDSERKAIEEVEQSDDLQRGFLRWLTEIWIDDAVRNGNQLVLPFILKELALAAPFERWSVFAPYRMPINSGGALSAIVLAGASVGEATDVRRIDTVLLPLDPVSTDRMIVPEGFHADAADLNSARTAARTLLSGPGLWRLVIMWAAIGRRPYPSWLSFVITAGWLAACATAAFLWFGPDPGESLAIVSAGLLGLWIVLLLAWLTGVGSQITMAVRTAKIWSLVLAHDQVRLRMPGRLTLKGGSAGLPFSLGILSSVGRAYPRSIGRSWLWQQFLTNLAPDAKRSWAATGSVSKDGYVRPVQVEVKIRACLIHGGIDDILTPAQKKADASTVKKLADISIGAAAGNVPGAKDDAKSSAVSRNPKIHRCRHIAEAVLAIARLPSPWQTFLNGMAVLFSGVMIWALPDLLHILLPPPSPSVVLPTSPSSYYLWVSLDTQNPDSFVVELDSHVWVNRRAEIALRESEPSSVRAEFLLVRQDVVETRNYNDGWIWIERRPYFLTRKFQPGEIVGRYSLAYLQSLGHDK